MRAICGSLAVLLLFAGLVAGASAQGPGPTWRFGADMVREFGRITDYDVASLGLAWYSDWGTSREPLRPGGIEYAQLVGVSGGVLSPPAAQLAALVDANPGALWLIGNEPECIWQGNSTPEQYAVAYHQAYTLIKSRDPTARVAIGGVVQPTPLRLEWLDRALAHYQSTYGQPMPVDVWNVHNMILQEERGSWGCEIPRGLSATSGRLYTVADNDNLEIFKQHVVDFRVWMRARGQRDKPLIITEYGVLMPVAYGFTPDRVSRYMVGTFDYLLTARDPELGCPADGGRLVQRWLWNSLNDQPWDPQTGKGFNGALFDYRYPAFPGLLTPVGVRLREYTAALAAGRVCLSGGVELAGRPLRPDRSYAITLTVQLDAAAGVPLVRTVPTDATGHFGLCGLAPGTYDLLVKGHNTLARRLPAVEVSADAPAAECGLLAPGDANGDNRTSILDYCLLHAAYATRQGEAGYQARADLNGDGQVDVLDYVLLANHYAKGGDR